MLNPRSLICSCVAALALVSSASAQHKFVSVFSTLIPSLDSTNGSGKSFPYPDTIRVSGVSRPIANVRVILPSLEHTYPDDLDIVLISPRGLAVVLMSDAGGTTDFSGTIVLESGSPPIPDSGALNTMTSYAPADYEPGDTPPMLPAGLTFTTLEGLRGTDANGYWRVFIFDDGVNDVGRMNQLQLEITESAVGPISIASLESTMLPDNALFTTKLAVAGLDGPIKNLRVRIFGLAHTFPADLDIGVLDPGGRIYVLMSDVGGGTDVSFVDLEFGLYPTPLTSSTLTSGRYAPTDINGSGTELLGPLGTTTANGRIGGGEWTLLINDDSPNDTGVINGWNLIFDPPCAGDFDRSGTLAPADIFEFLNAWFNGCP